ncbi:adhesion G-protein coupled receptor F3 [Anarrhichthys ocellatus]|uniref:adhesion G-protein coupled receptor F3 n=1 Tax=Anarrhichthys ocellatus TaxID=433405 RepID=UPI0012EEDA84|nr:adhesion G-protein coupled receptor F3-like [Anarrhichthys ocellatus]
MWTLFVLCILGLDVCLTNGEDNSTQMYYFNLTVEDSAIANVSEKLTTFVSSTNLKVDQLKMTTICQSVSTGTECSCRSDFIWSDRVCQESSEKCCGDKNCTFTKKPAPMCVSKETVAVSGSITLNGQEHYKCLEEKYSEEFQQCNNKILREMKTVYSTLAGFDMLTITKYRVGSIIVDFEMTFAYQVKQQQLIEKSKNLSSTLSASVSLETTGVVHLCMLPKSPVCYYHKPSLTCTAQEDLKSLPVWQLTTEGEIFRIFSGTESEVTRTTMETSVTLKNISKLWEGEYKCIYHQQSDLISITHKASAVMDISLLPKIYMTIAPTFPHCTKGSESLKIRVRCETESDNEKYNVTWEGQHIIACPFKLSDDVYAADVTVSCNQSLNRPQLTCTFKNRCKEERKASAFIDVIYENDPFCKADGDWEDTKAGFTAVLKCTNATGQRERKCNTTLGPTLDPTWEPEVSMCVKQAVNRVLQKANIVNIGLGSLDENAAVVFSLLESVTNDSETINTVADMNASVQVLYSLSQRINGINNDSTADGFLNSSSNMLEKSLNESWTAKANKGNNSLAETYLDSIENLIQKTNLTRAPKKKNIEVAASNCSQGSKCLSTVFNNSVELVSSDPVSVKTAGFKELGNYLPNKDTTFEPNSLIVSVTTERNQSDSVKVTINFSLIKPRPHNVKLKCVSWDNITSSWSSEGCEWQLASSESVCICTHLSSFAILMSKYPVKIRGLEELTLVGLSVSVVSLLLTLAIELIVWNAIVKTSTLYIRHTAHVNICLCLLIADCCFLASFKLSAANREMWCWIFVFLKHFCYLSMFFWMLCLSSMLLHQAIFLFHNMSKKKYLKFSLVLGYVCPLLIAVITFLSYNNGAEGSYYSSESCWLCYAGLMKGSIHTFVMPVGAIVFFNMFSMAVVIIKLLDHPKNREKWDENEKKAAITVMRSVILLTPIFGVTWIFGFAVMLLDLTSGTIVTIVHWTFSLLNSFQGLFILLTTCLADKLTRDALLKHLKRNAPASTTDSVTTLDSTWRN